MWSFGCSTVNQPPRALRLGAPAQLFPAHIIDAAVWDKVMEILRDPRIIAAEVQKHRNDGGLKRDLASIGKVLLEILEANPHGEGHRGN